MRQVIYLDESGDLGFNFSQPYQQGGSSRFLTIATVMLPINKTQLLERAVRHFYKKRNRPKRQELKSIHLSSKEKQQFANSIFNLKQQHSDIQFFAITIDKRRVKTSLRNNANALYNYAVKQLLIEIISQTKHVDLIVDARSERNNSRWNMAEYLEQMLIEESLKRPTINQSCNISSMSSHSSLPLQFVDYYVALVWSAFEFEQDRLAEFSQLDGVTQSLLFD